MKILRAHKIRLKPNRKQETYFRRAAGTARFAYNWALAEWQREYSAGGKPNEAVLRKRLNAVKRQEFPWMTEVTSRAPLIAIQNLGEAFSRFFRGQNRHPTFKKRGVHDSFGLTNDSFRIDGKKCRIPALGWVRMTERLRLEGKIMSATISRTADRWFVSVLVETDLKPSATPPKKAVGVDLGLKTFAVLSTGEKFDAPKPLKTQLKKLRRASRTLSRRKRGSSNRAHAKTKLSIVHYRVACIRSNFLHQLTSRLSKRFGTICIEDLHVKGMVKNRRLARSISDVAWSEFRRQIEYKCGDVRLVLRFFPSTKMCSGCGAVKNMRLSERTYRCSACGLVADRDINAAINIRTAGLAGTGPTCRPDACGEERARGASRKQEAGSRAMVAPRKTGKAASA